MSAVIMASRAPVNTSLVKYNTAVLVSTASKGNFKTPRKAKLPPPVVDKSAQSQTEEILNLILPPKETSEEGQLWVQYVSPDPATPADVKKLEEELGKRLVLRGAKEVGICPEREELYAQAFDEIIRQVTIICTDRGKVLVRVRNEANMTIHAYQTL